jgi:anti-sigma B factor antagonist
VNEGGIEVEELSETTAVVSLRGEHDVYTVPALRERLAELHERNLLLVIDLSQTAFLDSSVLGALLGASETARSRGRDVAVVLGDPPTQAVARIFEVTGLGEVLRARSSRAAAQELLSETSAP